VASRWARHLQLLLLNNMNFIFARKSFILRTAHRGLTGVIHVLSQGSLHASCGCSVFSRQWRAGTHFFPSDLAVLCAFFLLPDESLPNAAFAYVFFFSFWLSSFIFPTSSALLAILYAGHE
jgi:hypothetical protein